MKNYKAALITQAKRTGMKPEREMRELASKFQMLTKEKNMVEGQLFKINSMKLDAESKEHIIDDLKLTQTYTTLTKRVQKLVPTSDINKDLQSYTEASRDLKANSAMLNDPQMSVLGQLTEENKIEAEEGQGAEMMKSMEDEWMMELTLQMTRAEQGQTPLQQQQQHTILNDPITSEIQWVDERHAQTLRHKQALLEKLATPPPTRPPLVHPRP